MTPRPAQPSKCRDSAPSRSRASKQRYATFGPSLDRARPALAEGQSRRQSLQPRLNHKPSATVVSLKCRQGGQFRMSLDIVFLPGRFSSGKGRHGFPFCDCLEALQRAAGVGRDEEIADGRESFGKSLERRPESKSLHLPLALSKRDMGVLRSIVQSLVGAMFDIRHGHDHLRRSQPDTAGASARIEL